MTVISCDVRVCDFNLNGVCICDIIDIGESGECRTCDFDISEDET